MNCLNLSQTFRPSGGSTGSRKIASWRIIFGAWLFAGLLSGANAVEPDAGTNSPSSPVANTNAPPTVAGPAVYKKMSLEELMNQDVTSVSKEPERYADAPAAIQVITQDDIRRSGASSIPEALRLADNLEVAQINSHDWAISARGFNGQFADKL